MSEQAGSGLSRHDEQVAVSVLDAFGFDCLWGGIFNRDAFVDQAHVITHEAQARTIIETAQRDGRSVLIGPSATSTKDGVRPHFSTSSRISLGIWVADEDFKSETPKIPGVTSPDLLAGDRPRSINIPPALLGHGPELGPLDVD